MKVQNYFTSSLEILSECLNLPHVFNESQMA